jgi:hypothetical protein
MFSMHHLLRSIVQSASKDNRSLCRLFVIANDYVILDGMAYIIRDSYFVAACRQVALKVAS